MGNYAYFKIPIEASEYNEKSEIIYNHDNRKIESLIKKNDSSEIILMVCARGGKCLDSSSRGIIVKEIQISMSFCKLQKIKYSSLFTTYAEFEKAIMRENKLHDNFFDTEKGIKMLQEVKETFEKYPKGFIFCS